MKVGIVEDQVLYQRYLSDLITRELGYEVVLCCEDGVPAIRDCPILGVELLILDLKLQKMYGLEVAEQLLEKMPNLKILAFSGEINAFNLRMVESLGILGFLDKSDPVMKNDAFLVEAIRSVTRGKRAYSPGIETLSRELSRDADAFHKVLSPKKIEILRYIGKCWNDDEISSHTGLSKHTVRKHRMEMIHQLALDSNHQLIRYAQKNGFVNQPGDLDF